MVDYAIILLLLSLAGYCHVLAIRLKKLKFGAVEMQVLISKVRATLIKAEKSKEEIVQVTDKIIHKLQDAKVDTATTIDDLHFMVQRAEKVIESLGDVIQNDRRMRNSGESYDFKELLLKMAK